VRRETLAQLAYADDVGDILVLIRTLLDDPDALVVDAAIFALGEHLDANAVEKLSAIALEHEDARCRESAVAALGPLVTIAVARRYSPRSRTSLRCADALSSRSRTSRGPTSTPRSRSPPRTVTGRCEPRSINSTRRPTNRRFLETARAVRTSL